MPADDVRRRARDRVLLQLKLRGPQTAPQLARRLALTPAAVRQHLTALAEEGYVDAGGGTGAVGRPARVWRITPAAAARFPDAHADLSVDLLESLRESLGASGLESLLATRMRRQLAAYRERMPAPDAPLGRRVSRLAALRREEGYMAEASRQRDGSYLLVENHCPICAAAAVCQGLCRDELELFCRVLGDGVQVERGDHILAGARRCAYRIEARGAP